MNIQQLTAKYGKGTAVKATGIDGLNAKYANGAGLKRWEESKKTINPITSPTPTTTPTPAQPNIFQKAKTAVSNVFKPKTPPTPQPVSNNLGVGGNTPFISPEMTATPKQDKIMTETAKFGAKTVFGFADLITESLDYVTDYAAHNLVDKKKPQLKIIADANDKWTKFYDEQSALGNIPTQKLKKYVDTIQKSSFIQNSPEWEKSTTKEKLTTKLGETVLNLAPSVLSSAAAFIINPGFGFVVSAASTANDVKDTAIEYGVEPDKAEKLGLATGLLVGALDRIVPDEVMSGDVKNKFIGSFAKRILARVVKTGKTVLTEASTEVLQEDIQMIAEATFRDDLGWDEANTRQAMAGLGGFIGGAGFSMIGNFSDNTISKDILGRPDKVDAGVNVEEKPVEEKIVEKPAEVKPIIEEKPTETVVEPPIETKKEPIVTSKETVTPPKDVETTKITEPIKVTRQYSVGSEATPIRGGTWYFKNGSEKSIEGMDNVGGNLTKEDTISFKKPLIVENAGLDGSRDILEAGLEENIAVKEREVAIEIKKLQDTYPSDEEESLVEKETRIILKEYGLPEKEINLLFKNKNASDAVLDRIISIGLNKNGFDGVIFNSNNYGDKPVTHIFKIEKNPTQTDIVKETVKEKPKTIKEIAEETKIKEPNIRIILGVGEKEGTFERVDKGVYVLSKDGVDTAFIETGDSLESLPRLAKEGFKADMIFLDIPYTTKAVRGGNRGINFATISPTDFNSIVVPAVKTIAKNDDSPIVYMYSQGSSGKKDMLAYNKALMESGLIIVAKGTYSKTYKNGEPMKFGKYPMPPEGILVYNKSGKDVDLPKTFDIKAVAPLYKNHYQTEKASVLLKSIIEGTTKFGDMVLDPFSGSGVTLAEAVKLGRKAYGVEISKTAVEEKIKPRVKEAITLAPSQATDEESAVKEAAKAGVLNAVNLTNRKYNKPTIGVSQIKTLTSHPEFKANPVMTYTEDGKLYFKSNKLEVTVYPEALNINTENLTVGDKIRIDLDALKKAKGIQQTRLYKGNEVLGFNPKTITESPFSPEAKLEMDKVVRQQDIAEMLTKKLGVPLRRGKFRHAGAIGLYKSKQKVARYKSGGFPTVAHEAAGHYLDDMFGFSNNIDIEERRKLMTEYGYSYEGQPHKQRKEAFAEFMRFTLTGQNEKAKTFAPKFFEEYNTKIDKMPEIKKVLDEAAHQYKLYAEQPAVAKVASVLSVGQEKKPGFLQSLNQNLQDKYTQTLDELHPLDEFTKLYKKLVNNKLAGNLDPYMLARTFKGWQSKANLFLNKGTFGKTFWVKNKETGKAEMKFKGKSYSEIMKPVEQAGALDEFRVYVVAQRVVNDLAPRGKKSGIELKDAKQALEELNKSHPEFEKVAEERRQYKDELLDFAAENGLIGSDQLARIKELNKYHVPFYRVMEEMSSGFMGKKKIAGNMGSPIKSFKGSDRLIIDPFESDIKDTYAIINAAERNNIGIAMANLANKHYELGRLFEKVDAPMKATTVSVKEVLVKALEGTETTTDDIPEDLEDMMVTLFRPTQDRGANMLNVNVGDKKLVYQVDPDLFKAIQGMNAEEVNAIVKLMSMPAKALRLGATLSPDFAVRNPFRDLFSAFVYSNYGFTPGVDFVKGVFEVMKKGDIYNLWVAGGGENSMMVSMDRGNLQKSFKEMMRTNKQEALSYAKNPIKFLRILSELGEAGTRLGEMKRAINAGADPITAAFASREVTLDFARIGAKTKAINMIIAFFNANIQGTDKMVRSFRKAPVRSLAKSIIGITLPSILLYLANRDDKRWKEIPRWQKDLFWIVLTPNHVWRIPKPFELGTIFGSVPERILEYMETKDPKVFTQLEKSIMDGFTPGFIPTGLLPIWENISNYSFFRDQPIVSEGQLNLPPEEQSSRYTSEVAKIIGNVLGYPPLKIDNLIQGYTGGLGKYTTSFIDTILTNTGIVPSDVAPPSKTLEDMPVIKAFMVRNPVGSQSESVNRIYTEFEDVNARLTQAKKLLNEGEMEKFNNYVKKYPEAIDAIPLQAVITSFTKLNQVADLIRKDKTLSPDEKRDKLLKIDEFKTEMARTTLDQIDKDRLERDKKEKPPKTSMKFDLVKTAYAAEGLETKSQKLTDEQNALKRKVGLVKFVDGVKKLFGNTKEDRSEKALTAKRQRYNTMLRLRDEDFNWYKENISQADEKVLLGGMDLNTHNLSQDASGKLILTKDLKSGEVKGIAVTKTATPTPIVAETKETATEATPTLPKAKEPTQQEEYVRKYYEYYNAPFSKYAKTLVEYSNKDKLDYRIAPVIIQLETSGGKHISHENNPGNIAARQGKTYSTMEQGIRALTSIIGGRDSDEWSPAQKRNASYYKKYRETITPERPEGDLDILAKIFEPANPDYPRQLKWGVENFEKMIDDKEAENG